MFSFDLISSSVESLITKKKTLAKNCLFFFFIYLFFIFCFLAVILKAHYEELHFIIDSSFPHNVRYQRYRRQGRVLSAVPWTRRRHRNRVLPGTLPTVPHVPLRLYGNQALVIVQLIMNSMISCMS